MATAGAKSGFTCSATACAARGLTLIWGCSDGITATSSARAGQLSCVAVISQHVAMPKTCCRGLASSGVRVLVMVMLLDHTLAG